MAAVSLAPQEAGARRLGPSPRKLRVGVFAGSRLQPRWVAEAFAGVAASGFAEVVLVECGAAAPARPPLAWRLYAKLDRWAFGGDASDPVDLPAVLPPGVSPDEDLDVAFALGDIDDTRLDGLARHGVWRFHFDGEPEALAGARAVAQGDPLSASALKVRLAAGAAPRLAYQSWARTYPFSVARNRDALLRKTGEFLLRALRELHASGRGWLEQCKVLPVSTVNDFSSRTPIDICSRLLRRGLEKALHIEQWSIAFRMRGQGCGEAAIAPDLAGFTRLVPPPDRDWADPFPLEKNGRHFIFFEEKPYASGKAHIAVTEVGPGGRFSPPQRVLERDYHLSYPFLLEHEGALYMVPESAQNATVELWRCVEFPGRWKLEKVLLEGLRCADATLHRAHGRWWMFANAAPAGSRSFDDELHLFHAEHLTGAWKPHPRNPIRSDARSARPAGALYWRRGALYRPAQVCVPRYGAGLSIQRVLRLSSGEYAERQVERILPSPQSGILGIHTLNRAGYLTVVDAFTRRRRSFTP